ncbi:ricin B-like lectin [Flagelloscypha sp. PMI_526]|nr:ricin B-like lectin [Flagelloscypha sp. PMI_526]
MFSKIFFAFVVLPLTFAAVLVPRAPSKETIEGDKTYKITNVKSGTVVDLSAYDGKSIIGYPWHNGTNQQWTLKWADNGWHIVSVENGYFMSFDATAANGVNVTGVATISSEPSVWHIWQDEDNKKAFRICVPDTTQVLDLYDRGNAWPGEPITLWNSWNGTHPPHQTWTFTKLD